MIEVSPRKVAEVVADLLGQEQIQLAYTVLTGDNGQSVVSVNYNNEQPETENMVIVHIHTDVHESRMFKITVEEL